MKRRTDVNQPPTCSAVPADTSVESLRVEVEALRRLAIAGRAKLTFDLIEQLALTTESGIRSRHPSYSARQIRLARNRLWWGDELFGQVCPGVEIET